MSHVSFSPSGSEDCALDGVSLLQSPYFNKGSAFSDEERRVFKLRGLLPPNIQTLDDQLLQEHLKEMLDIVYTPTEGDAIQNFSHIFRKPEGCFLSVREQNEVHDRLAQWGDAEDVDYIVVTDGEENEALLNDELYLGLRQRRASGEEYDSFVDRFVQSARELYPKAVIHFEDFGLANARRILSRYKNRIACFNDDIQGTGCVTLAAILSGLYITRTPLTDLRVLVFGAGSAGTGIADQIRDAIATHTLKSKEDASKQLWYVGSDSSLCVSLPRVHFHPC
ncbi:MAG: NAD-dependent malic enzyme, mitochondrial [Lichina confinis]|nr:MAG: NAD-dependent malic enzyme, mitochondrial [Lichina confinis]